MSLRPLSPTHIPNETITLMHTIFPKGHPFFLLREELGVLFTDEHFLHLYDPHGRPATSPALLSLVSVLQFLEGLTDRQAADAVRTRIDWKYVLGLALTDTGFDSTLLSDFRTRLSEEASITLLFDTVLTAFKQRGLLKARGKHRSDSTHVLAAIRTLERIAVVGETLRHTLEQLAIEDPPWVRAHVPQEWVDRYAERFDSIRMPKEQTKRMGLAHTIGHDGQALLTSLHASDTPSCLREIPAVQILQTVWAQHYTHDGERLRWRETPEMPPSGEQLVSPFDTDARYGKKRQTEWTGYTVHITETCDEDAPHFITDVQTVVATTPDTALLPIIQEAHRNRDLCPDEHYVDAGYMSANHLVQGREHGVEIIGRVNEDTAWQSRTEGAYTVKEFVLDWEEHTAICPQGKESIEWRAMKEKVQIPFSKETCGECGMREHCTRATTSGRVLKIWPQPLYEAVQQRREEQQTNAFRTKYQRRAGIEGTISQGIRGFDLRYARYWGLSKTRLQHVLVTIAINLVRLMAWLCGNRKVPAGRRRDSIFVETMKGVAIV